MTSFSAWFMQKIPDQRAKWIRGRPAPRSTEIIAIREYRQAQWHNEKPRTMAGTRLSIGNLHLAAAPTWHSLSLPRRLCRGLPAGWYLL